MSPINAVFLCAFTPIFLESLHPEINDSSQNLSAQDLFFKDLLDAAALNHLPKNPVSSLSSTIRIEPPHPQMASLVVSIEKANKMIFLFITSMSADTTNSRHRIDSVLQ